MTVRLPPRLDEFREELCRAARNDDVSSHMRRPALFILTLFLTVSLAIHCVRAGDSQPSEYQLKAAYIYHFAQFVEWPATAFAETNSPLVVGILGDNPFGNDLRRTVDGKVLGNHPMSVQEFHSLSQITNNCHILFISSSEEKKLPGILSSLHGTSTLTVAEFKHFADDGGMIQFDTEDARIRFEINKTVAEKSGLKMSFKLLSLASHVR